MSTVVNSTITLGSGKTDQTYDLNGVKYQRGSSLGDKPIISLIGKRNKALNFSLDDMNLSGVNGVCSIGGEDNLIERVLLDRCQRYGFIFTSAIRGILRKATILKAQHCISGSNSFIGQWAPSIDCIIDDCDISGMILDAMKFKNMLRCKLINSRINIYPKYPGYDGQSTKYSKTAIYFAATDSSNVDCIAENNRIFSPTKVALGNYGVLVHPDATDSNGNFLSSVRSSGNKIRNNIFENIYTYGMWFRKSPYPVGASGYLAENNQMINVTKEYQEDVPGSNTIIPFTTGSLVGKLISHTIPLETYVGKDTSWIAKLKNNGTLSGEIYLKIVNKTGNPTLVKVKVGDNPQTSLLVGNSLRLSSLTNPSIVSDINGQFNFSSIGEYILGLSVGHKDSTGNDTEDEYLEV